MLESPGLEGHIVRMEPLTLAHLPGLVEAASGPRDTFTYTLVPHDTASARTFIEIALAERDAGTSIAFATIDRRTSRIAGTTRFLRIEYWDWPEGSPHQRGSDLPDAVEIGYTWLASWAQHSGINTEAKLLMLTYAFETWGVHRVRLTTDARNFRSRAAIGRLGARLDGILRAHHQAYDGEIRDSAFYSILDSEWPAAKAALTARLRLD